MATITWRHFKKMLFASIIMLTFFLTFSYFNSLLPKPLKFENKVNLPLEWKKKFDERITPYWDVTHYGDLVISTNCGKIYLMDINNSYIKIELLLPKSHKTALILDNTQIFAIVNEKTLYNLDLKDQKIVKSIESYNKSFYNENIKIYNNYIYFWDSEGNITVLNTDTKNVIYKKLFSGLKAEYLYHVSVSKDILYYSKKGYNIYALNLDTLNEIWHYDIGAERVSSEPFFLNDKIYLRSNENIEVFDPLNGAIIDEFTLYGYLLFSDGVSLYAVGNTSISKINIDTGTLDWISYDKTFFPIVEKECIFYRLFKTKDNIVIVKIDKYSGEKIWETKLDHYKFNIEKVISTEKYDIIERNDGAIFLLDKNTGEKLWRFDETIDRHRRQHFKKIKWTVYQDMLIIFDGEKTFYAYSLK